MKEECYRLTKKGQKVLKYLKNKKGDQHDNGTDIHNSEPDKRDTNNWSTLKGYTLHNDLCYL